jgi:NTP pyrophosphatase (non-canonical NTP hydrolase)
MERGSGAMKQETIARIRKFSKERDWDQFHTPANLAKSISIEANELLECFQWSDTDYDLSHVGEELADVMVYCQNMLDALGLDADAIINAKMVDIVKSADSPLYPNWRRLKVIHPHQPDPHVFLLQGSISFYRTISFLLQLKKRYLSNIVKF